jgi:hypothetical protein
MKILEKTSDEALNDEALDFVAGGFWDDNGCTPLIDFLKHILHPTKPGGPINSRQ